MSTFVRETLEIVQDEIPYNFKTNEFIHQTYRRDWIQSILTYMRHGFVIKVTFGRSRFLFADDPSHHGRVYCHASSHFLPIVGRTMDWEAITTAFDDFRAYIETKEFIGDSLAMALEPREAETGYIDNNLDTIFMSILEDVIDNHYSRYKVNNFINVPNDMYLEKIERRMFDQKWYLQNHSPLSSPISTTK